MSVHLPTMMACIRRLCCFKKEKAYDVVLEDDKEDTDFVPAQYVTESKEGSEPQSFFRSSVLSIYKRVDSAYKQVSEWSLPKNTQVNLFTLSSNDMDEYEENNFFDDVVDEKF